VCSALRSFLRRPPHDLGGLCVPDDGGPARSARILEKPINTCLEEATAPSTRSVLAAPEFVDDLGIGVTFCTQKDNPHPFHDPLRRLPCSQ
jgi:hypothetical protein